MSQLLPNNWMGYLDVSMVLLRLMGLFILLPGFSHRTIPPMVKLFLALAISFCIHPLVQAHLAPPPESAVGVFLYVFRETVVGFLLGFIAYLTFEAIHLAAQFVGYQMGFGTVGLIDPVNQSSVSPLVPLNGWVALMLFFATNLHHHLLTLFVSSFEVTHSIQIQLLESKPLLHLFVDAAAKLFVVAVQMAAPFTFLVLASNVTVGILARMLPHMHVILFTFPITILLGLGALYLVAPEMVSSVENILDDVWVQSTALLQIL